MILCRLCYDCYTSTYFNYYGLPYLFPILISKRNTKEFRAVGNKVRLILAVPHTAHTWQLNYEDSGLAFTGATFHGTANFAIGSRFWSNHRDKRGTNKFLPFCNRARDNFLCVLSSRAYVDSTIIQRQPSISFWSRIFEINFTARLCAIAVQRLYYKSHTL